MENAGSTTVAPAPPAARQGYTIANGSKDAVEAANGAVVALIPAYNEARFIGSLVLAARLFVDLVIVIDDGSCDNTEAIARRAGATVLRHAVNQGKAVAINTGFAYVRQLRPRAVVMLDGDGQHFADDIPSVLAPVLAGAADIAIGSRFLDVKSDIPIYRQVGQHGLTMATNLASGVYIGDSQSGFRAFSPHALEQLFFSSSGFSIESEMQFLAREYKLTITEVPIRVMYAEPAKRSPVAHGMQVLHGIMQLVGQTRPLLFFGLLGLLTFLSGVALGLTLIDTYAQSRSFPIGYGLISVVLCMIGVVLIFAGVILHSMRGMLLTLQTVLLQRLKKYSEEVAYPAVLITEEPPTVPNPVLVVAEEAQPVPSPVLVVAEEAQPVQEELAIEVGK